MFIDFAFSEGVTIIYWLENMKLSVFNMEESYKDTIIGNMGNSGTSDLVLHIVQCFRACALNEENQDIPLVLYFSHMVYTYYSRLGFYPI